MEYAATKKIPMVNPDWFIACVREQTRLPYESYQIDSSKLKTFLVHGKSMLQFDASKRKANDKDNDPLNPGQADASKRRRAEASNPAPDGSTSGNKPPKSRSDPGEETKLKSKSLKVTPVSKILRDCRVYVSREKLEVLAPPMCMEFNSRFVGPCTTVGVCCSWTRGKCDRETHQRIFADPPYSPVSPFTKK